MSDGGKGSAPRPFSVDADTFASNWDRIFGKNKQSTEKEKEKSDVISQGQDSTKQD